jgi:arsenite methyltransferase
MTMPAQTVVDSFTLETAVKSMYRRVALEPSGEFHFELGRQLAERLGYSPARLDRVPAPAIDSFAGVGHHFDLAELTLGEQVLDLGSGSGMDSFVAATYVGAKGRVVGVDMTDAQREKASTLRGDRGPEFANVEFVAGHIETLPFAASSFDCVISNGVINLVVEKERVFREAFRVLKPGGRLALSDIVTATVLPQSVVCDATLWAECIAGAMQREAYQQALQDAGFTIHVVQPNPQYQFLSGRAFRSARKYEVSSLSLLAVKP